MTKTMRALVYKKPGRVNGGICNIPYPACGDTQIIIKVMACGICKPAEKSHDRQGSVLGRYPATPGHEFAGIVAETGGKVKNFRPGDRVTADNGVPCKTCYYCQKGQPSFCENFGSLGHNLQGGMAQYVAVEEEVAFHIPQGVSMNSAALSELIGCCYNCVEKSNIMYGDDVLILGCGSSGMLLAQMVKNSHANRVAIVDSIAGKLQRIAAKGIETALIERADYSVHEARLKQSFPKGFDKIIDTTGCAELMNRSVELLKCGGTFVGYSFPTGAERNVSLDMGLFIRKELTYMGTTFQSNHFQRCLDALASGKVDAEMIISHEYPLEKYFEALDKNLSDEESIKIIIHPNEA